MPATDSLGQLVTTDAAVHTLWAAGGDASGPASPDSTVFFEIPILARASDGTSATFVRRVCAKRSGGAVSIVGAVDATFTQADPGAAAWTCTLDVIGTIALRLRVQGDAGHSVTWIAPGWRVIGVPWTLAGAPGGFATNLWSVSYT